MKNIIYIGLILSQVLLCQNVVAQETNTNQKTEKTSQESEEIKQKKEKVIAEEKEALKNEVVAINRRLNDGEISEEEANKLKEDAAEIHALNIENKIAIIENSVALSDRSSIRINTEDVNIEIGTNPYRVTMAVFDDDQDSFVEIDLGKPKKHDKRTHSNLLVAFGLNNAIIEGQSIDDSPYKIGKSKFFEMGWVWSTRLLNNSNAIRLRYGFSFTFNGLNPTDGNYFVQDGNYTYLEPFTDGGLNKSKLRMDNLVIPVHFEFGPSKKIESKNYYRYSTRKQFKFGIGGYGGVNLGTRQKLKYSESGSNQKDKLKKSYNTANFIYGISSYVGVDSFSLYVKYDLNTIFNDPNINENNISLGLRFDL